MKRLVLAATVLILGGMSGVSRGQDLHKSPYEERLSRFRAEKPRVASAEQLIFERARSRAQQRAARLEMYQWLGYSPTRPRVSDSAFMTEQNPGLTSPWGYGYRTWTGRW